MKDFDKSRELTEKNNWIKKIFEILFILLFATQSGKLLSFFENEWFNYALFMFALLIYGFALNLLNKKRNQPIDFDSQIKSIGILIVVFLLLYNFVKFIMIPISEITPDSVSQFFPLILAAGFVLFLIGLGFHFLQKITKI